MRAGDTMRPERRMTTRKPSARASAGRKAKPAAAGRKATPPKDAGERGEDQDQDRDDERDEDETLQADAELAADPIEAEVVMDDAGTEAAPRAGTGPRRASAGGSPGPELAVVRDDAEDTSSRPGVSRDALGRFMSEVRRHP